MKAHAIIPYSVTLPLPAFVLHPLAALHNLPPLFWC